MGLFRKKLQPTKTKEITEQGFKGDWPFKVDKVTLELHGKYWAVVNINEKRYSLNGAAKDRFNYTGVHDAEVVHLGAQITDFIKMTLELN